MYHYTTINKLEAIRESGKLMPTATKLAPGELPALWFSTNPVWEPTAAKMNLFGNLYTFEEHVEMIGLCRFTLKNTSLLYPYKRLKKIARIPDNMAARLEAVGRAQGANPNHWYGTLKSIPLPKLGFEIYDEGRWLDFQSDDLDRRLGEWLAAGV